MIDHRRLDAVGRTAFTPLDQSVDARIALAELRLSVDHNREVDAVRAVSAVFDLVRWRLEQVAEVMRILCV